jgi:hypothetical protein
MTMADAVERALAARKAPDAQDAAAEALARHYAGLIDNAQPQAKYHRALRVLAAPELHEPEEVAEAFEAVRVALAEHSVASDLGPKLAAILDKLGLTTAARGVQKAGGKNDAAPDPLDAIRADRQQRRGAHVSR